MLIAALVLFARMSGPVQSLQQAVQNIAAYAPAFVAIERRLGPLVQRAAIEPKSAPRLDWHELEAEKASFMHAPGLGVAFATLRLVPGQWLGISGASGAGKTTLVDLVTGLLTPQEGRISVDGRTLEGVTLERWREGLAYVGQEGSVFDDSVRGNLLAEGVSADEAELWSALDAVGLTSRIRAWANGLDERVGDRGSALSGGERQRLAIARALLRRPSLLILDEATSALDTEGEAALLDQLRTLDPRPAALIVAHRPSTLAHCDWWRRSDMERCRDRPSERARAANDRKPGLTSTAVQQTMRRSAMMLAGKMLVLGAAAFVAAAACATPSIAQDQQDQRTPKNFSYDIKDGKRVPKGNRVTNADGSWPRRCVRAIA